MSEEQKENTCMIEFQCICLGHNGCVYFKDGTIDKCVFENPFGYCNSAIAKTNSMIIELKKMGVGFILAGRLDEIKSKLKLAVERNGLKPVEDVLKMLEAI